MVGGLVLAEANFGCVRVAVERFLEAVVRDRVQHFDANDRDVLTAELLAALFELVVELAGHQHDGLDLVGITNDVAFAVNQARVVDDRLELLDLGEVFHGGGCVLETKHRLRGEDDQRALEVAKSVATQQVEVVCRGRRLGNRHGALSAQLQVTLDACRGVVRAHALVAVRQQQDDTGGLAPLGFTGADVLVNDGLRAISEVTELCFPGDHGVGVTNGVAVFEAHACVFGQRRVVDQELAFALGTSKFVDRVEFCSGVRVDHHCVTLGECTATGILTCETNELAGSSQGTEGQKLAPTPVDAALADAFCTLLRDGCDARVSSEALRKIDVGLSDLHEFFAGDGGVQTVRKFLRTGDALLSLSLLLFSELNLVEDGLHLVVEVTCNCFSVLVGQVTAANQVFGVLGAGGFAVVDDVVHLRLSHRRVVGFVVATAAVAHEVDEDVLAEATAVLGRESADPHDSLGVVAVDVEHRAAESLRYVGGVVAGAGGIRCGGETDLVVNHDVDGAADGVTAQLGEVDGLGHDAKASERGVTMKQDRHDGVAVRAEV